MVVFINEQVFAKMLEVSLMLLLHCSLGIVLKAESQRELAPVS